MPFATLHNIVLYYELHGSPAAPPVVLIAGRSSEHSIWLPNLRKLSEQFRVLVFDHRGIGRSSVPTLGYTIRQMAKDTLGLMQHVGCKHAHVVGASMGGYIAQEMALLAPQHIGGLVLAGTVAHSDAWLDNVWTMTLRLAADQAQRETQVRQSLLLNFSPDFLDKPGMLDGLVQYGVSRLAHQTLEGLRGHVAACRGHDTRERLGSISAPTLVLAGEQDILMPLSRVRQVAEAIPGATFQVLPGGHAFMTESPEKFNSAVLAFLAEQNHLLDSH